MCPFAAHPINAGRPLIDPMRHVAWLALKAPSFQVASAGGLNWFATSDSQTLRELGASKFTPVGVLSTPEPSTWALMLIGFAGLCRLSGVEKGRRRRIETGIKKLPPLSFRDEPALTLYRDGEVRAFHNLDADWGASFALSTRHFLDVLAGRESEEALTAQEGRRVIAFYDLFQRSNAERRALAG